MAAGSSTAGVLEFGRHSPVEVPYSPAGGNWCQFIFDGATRKKDELTPISGGRAAADLPIKVSLT
jgi:hypothetical protein